MLPNSEDNMMKIISARCSLRGRDLLEDVLEAAAAPGMSPQSGESLVVSQRRNMSPWQPETRRTTGTTSAMPRLSSSARLVLGRVQLLRWSIISLSSNHFLTSEVRGQQIQFSPHSDYEEIRILPKLGLWLLNSGGKLSRLCTAGRAVSVLALGNRLCLWFKVIFWVSSGGLADDLVVPRHQRGGVAPISKLRAPHGGRLHPRVRRQQPRLLQLCPAHEVRETQIFFSSSKYFSLAGTKSWCHEACRTSPWWWWPTRWTFSPTRTPRREASWDKTSATRSVRLPQSPSLSFAPSGEKVLEIEPHGGERQVQLEHHGAVQGAEQPAGVCPEQTGGSSTQRGLSHLLPGLLVSPHSHLPSVVQSQNRFGIWEKYFS